ncbi:MAG: formate dehydrogenase accessory sulfurtransferase FdhD [Burkholderiaceae bacterium]
MLLLREDIGRHNALDKLVGALLRAGHPVEGFICITSRAASRWSRRARAGVAVLAAVSAPTALAVDTAQACGQLLLGFVRGDDLIYYT